MKERRVSEEMHTFFMKDLKNYTVRDESKTKVWIIIICILAALAYVSESDYKECLKGIQSIVLCGGGNSK